MLRYSLGPIQYFWPRAQVRDFYRQAAESPVDLVYLGETVCAKRRELRLEDYLAVAHELREAGKEVVLSTMTLLESPADLRELRRYCDNGEFMLEANDFGAIGLLREQGLPFVAGAAINCYSHRSLLELIRAGLKRWVMPVELSRDWLKQILDKPEIQEIRERFEVEVFGFGRIPLAWSARCFTARSENRPKDQCELCCIQYPEGRPVRNQEGERLFTLNGVQTQSGDRYNLVNQVPGVIGLVDVLRLSPQTQGTFDWLARFDRAGREGARYSLAPGDVNGYWHKMAGIVQMSETTDQS